MSVVIYNMNLIPTIALFYIFLSRELKATCLNNVIGSSYKVTCWIKFIDLGFIYVWLFFFCALWCLCKGSITWIQCIFYLQNIKTFIEQNQLLSQCYIQGSTPRSPSFNFVGNFDLFCKKLDKDKQMMALYLPFN